MVFFFNDTATTEIYTLSLHDALPICSGNEGTREADGQEGVVRGLLLQGQPPVCARPGRALRDVPAGSSRGDRKSTRLNSSHANISYAVFCLKKKKNTLPHHLFFALH